MDNLENRLFFTQTIRKIADILQCPIDKIVIVYTQKLKKLDKMQKEFKIIAGQIEKSQKLFNKIKIYRTPEEINE